jgi:hypothetical protein
LAAPHICWRPDLAALCADELHYLGQTWSALRQDDNPPWADSIDLSEVEAACDYAIQWTRLILPLVGADGAVTRLLAGNIPHDRTPRFNAPMR